MLKVAVVGLGDIAAIHLLAIENYAGAELVGICDTDPSRWAIAPDVPFFTGYMDMVKAVKPDCVHICLPHHLHYPVARELAALGCSLFVEKPPALNGQEAALFAGLEKEYGVSVCVCLQNRYNKTVQVLYNELRSGKAGDIKGIYGAVPWYRSAAYYADKPWRGSMAAAGGGVMINQAIHTLDLMRWLVGQPVVSLKSTVGKVLDYGIEVEDTVTARMRFKKGAVGLFSATVANLVNQGVQLEVRCENASYRIENSSLWKMEGAGKVLLAEDEQPKLGKAEYGNSHNALVAQYYSQLQTGGSEYVHPEQALPVMQLIDAIWRSSKSGREEETAI